MKQTNAQLFNDFLNYQGQNGRELYRKIHRYIKQTVKDDFIADDVMAEMQLKLLRKIKEGKMYAGYDRSKKLEPWLYTVAYNSCMDYQRKNKRHRNAISLDQQIKDPYLPGDYERKLMETIDCAENAAIVRKCIPLLPDITQQPIVLVYFYGLKYKEAADNLKIPLGTFKSRIHKGLLQLEQLLKRAA